MIGPMRQPQSQPLRTCIIQAVWHIVVSCPLIVGLRQASAQAVFPESIENHMLIS